MHKSETVIFVSLADIQIYNTLPNSKYKKVNIFDKRRNLIQILISIYL